MESVKKEWKSGKEWEIDEKHAGPQPGAPTVGVFSTGVTPTSEFVCVLPFPDGDAKRHKGLSLFGQEKAQRPAGGGELLLFCT